MNIRDALLSTYCENPCQVLPNALWKTLAGLENLQTAMVAEKDVVMSLHAWNETNLMVYWTRRRKQSFEFDQPQANPGLALIHQDYLPTFPSAKFSIREPYFRLIHRQNESRAKTPVPYGFSFVEVNIPKETGMVADLIGQCYQDLQPTVESVISWSKHPTFDPALWVWVMDDSKGIPIGLGIAERDNAVLEGSLEWIQVLPNYRGRGIGKCLVQELLSRLEKRVNFTTVAGQADNTTNPEGLYRSCGFKGSDIWWVFRN